MPIKRNFFTTCRKEKGIQKKVAKENGISEVYTRMIKNGTFTPGRDLLFELYDIMMSGLRSYSQILILKKA
ncbi:helix-turn-helix domain-containing protein [Desulfosporosinus nitroreducens]|uniref:helix-turn-helix domain-containing protein n=1 Tax=Desulfosporosinus nitroreducens TaxID=2018668 RepID=UPI00207C2C16|nr:helix-turn-helix domain-containing protein [Desulfosporosinus nitroreducens]MCO1603670.1 helix-turn-helix domain-containing protein [Desulfosporosinus nitroreducens]